jgi:Tol biopolymer transport system component
MPPQALSSRLVPVRPAALVLAAGLALASASSAQVTKINGPLTSVGGGRITQLPLVTPDGTRVVYREEGEERAIFSARVDGAEPPVRLTAPEDVSVGAPFLSPDGARVVFEKSKVGEGAFLFSRPTDGSAAPIQLTPTGADDLRLVAFSADSTRFVYTDDTLDPGRPDLYSVPVDGSAPPLQLNHFPDVESEVVVASDRVVWRRDGTFGGVSLHSVPIDRSSEPLRLDDPGHEVGGFHANPDGTRILYGQQVVAGQVELFSVPIDRSQAPVRLNPELVVGGDVAIGSPESLLLFSPDGTRVVYIADQRFDEVRELFSVPVDGSAAAVRISGDLVAGGDVQLSSPYGPSPRVVFSPDGARVLYLADQVTDEVLELFIAPVDGSQPALRVSGALVPGGDVPFGHDLPPQFGFSADGQHAFYLADELSDDVIELFRVPLDGSRNSVRRSEPLVAGGDVHSMRISAGHVVYRADRDTDEVFQLFSAAAGDLSAPIELNTELDDGVDPFRPAERVDLFSVHPDGSVFFLANPEQPRNSLYHVPVDGGAASRRVSDLQPPSSYDGGVDLALYSPDGAAVFYLARGYAGDEDAPSLFRVELASLTAQRIGGPLIFGGDTLPPGVQSDVLFSPDGGLVLYRAPQDRLGYLDLYGAPNSVGGVAQRLSVGTSGMEHVWGHALTADGSRAVYFTETGVYSVRVDGSELPRLLHATPDGAARQLRVSPDGERALFVEDGFALRSVPVDGSGPALLLQQPAVYPIEFGVDPSWVVFVSDATTDDVAELFAAPPDGSAPPVNLSGPLVSGGSVLDFRINALGTHVVFRADKDVDEVVDLYVVPIDGSSAPVRRNLSRPLADVQADYELSHDGLGVAYRSDQDVDEVYELYVVPLSGGLPAKRSGSLVTGGDVTDFRIGPGDEYLVFRADKEANEVFELYRAGVFGGAVARVSGPMVSGGDVMGSTSLRFGITADGRRVVYVADQLTDGMAELFSAPLADPDGTWRRENAALIASGDVAGFRFAPSGRDLVYWADQEVDGNAELYRVSHPSVPKILAAPTPQTTVVR